MTLQSEFDAQLAQVLQDSEDLLTEFQKTTETYCNSVNQLHVAIQNIQAAKSKGGQDGER